MAAPRAPQDRKPRQRKPTAAELAAADATDLDRVEAEAEALDGDWLTVPLPDDAGDVRVLPFMAWPRATYRRIVRGGDFEAVEDVIHDDDRAVFDSWDSTIGDLIAWVGTVVAAAGQAIPESGASTRSVRPIRGR